MLGLYGLTARPPLSRDSKTPLISSFFSLRDPPNHRMSPPNWKPPDTVTTGKTALTFALLLANSQAPKHNTEKQA